jgi:hypothetical protein
MYPTQCRDFFCPYLLGAPIHRPDTFEAMLRELGGNLCAVIPYVSDTIAVDVAVDRIRTSRSMPCAVRAEPWSVAVLSLDQADPALWSSTADQRAVWSDARG